MSLGFKLIIPGALALYLASACQPDFAALSALHGTTAGFAGMEPDGEGGSGNESSSSGGRASSGGKANSSGGSGPAAVCENLKKDTNESDVDCGGTSDCIRCATAARCTANRDCETDFCKSNHCAEPTCTDGVRNQDETAADCGGSCKPCDVGVACTVKEDCTGEYCANGVCSDHCISGTREADETDKDCGGSCSPCADNLKCAEGADCTSKICSNKMCLVPTCVDLTKNQDESDTDCGGICASTKACVTGARCNTEADCASWICSPTTKKCLDDIVVAPTSVIDDFEDGDMSLPPLEMRVGPWYAYNDMTVGGTGFGEVSSIKRGASTKGFHTTGKGFTTWGSGCGTDLNHASNKLPYNASAYAGVTFWARAETPLIVTVALPDLDTDKLTVGKTCTECDHHYIKNVSVTAAWQRFTILWSDLTLEPGGAPIPVPAFNPGTLSSVQFRFSPGQVYDAYFDDIAFVKP